MTIIEQKMESDRTTIRCRYINMKSLRNIQIKQLTHKTTRANNTENSTNNQLLCVVFRGVMTASYAYSI